MAKIKLLCGRAGKDGNYAAGEVVEVSDAEAKRAVKAGLARPAEDDQENAGKKR